MISVAWPMHAIVDIHAPKFENEPKMGKSTGRRSLGIIMLFQPRLFVSRALYESVYPVNKARHGEMGMPFNPFCENTQARKPVYPHTSLLCGSHHPWEHRRWAYTMCYYGIVMYAMFLSAFYHNNWSHTSVFLFPNFETICIVLWSLNHPYICSEIWNINSKSRKYQHCPSNMVILSRSMCNCLGIIIII